MSIHSLVRRIVGLAGLACFAAGLGFGSLMFGRDLLGKFGGDVFHNGANDTIALIIVGLFGGSVYLLANIDRQLAQRAN